MHFDVVFFEKDLTTRVELATPLRVNWEVDYFEFDEIGGPAAAKVRAKGEEGELQRLFNLLRCPIEIYDYRTQNVWWGYLNQADVVTKWRSFGSGLTDMFNKIKVPYEESEDDAQPVFRRGVADFVTDADSVAEYGTKELVEELSTTKPGIAQNMRTRLLNTLANPIITTKDHATPNLKKSEATLLLSGWWDTLEWEYITNTDLAGVETTTLISTVAGAGQFINSVTIEDASGLTMTEFENDEQTRLAYILGLMAIGTDNNRRLLAKMDYLRNLTIYEEPTRVSPKYQRGKSSRFFTSLGHELPATEVNVVGQWMEDREVASDAEGQVVSIPNLIFVKTAKFENERVQVQARTQQDFLQFLRRDLEGLRRYRQRVSKWMQWANWALDLNLEGLRVFWVAGPNNGTVVRDLSGNGMDLTINNSAPTTTINQSAYFDFTPASTHYLSRADEATLETPDGLTVITGGVLDTLAASVYAFTAKRGAAANNIGWELRKQATTIDTLRFSVSTDGSTLVSVTSTTKMAADTPFVIAGRFTASTELAAFLLTADDYEKATNTTSIPATIFDGNKALGFGAYGDGVRIMDGKLAFGIVCAAALPDEVIRRVMYSLQNRVGILV